MAPRPVGRRGDAGHRLSDRRRLPPVTPDGKHLVLSMDVYPDAKTLAETAARDDAKDKDKVKALVYDELLFRHWDTWEDGKRSLSPTCRMPGRTPRPTPRARSAPSRAT
ncbi:MAG: hypothetical protein U1F43_18520 [Myxococcota bacterium]